MIIFETNKIFQRFIGLQSSGPGSHQGYIIAPILISIPMLSLVLSISLNFIVNIHDDTNRVWSTLPTTIALFVFLILYWHLLINRRHFYSLFEDMQDIVDESAWQRKKPKAQVQQLFYLFDRIFCRIAKKWKALRGIAAKDQNSDENMCVHLSFHSSRNIGSIRRGVLSRVPGELYDSFVVSILSALVNELTESFVEWKCSLFRIFEMQDALWSRHHRSMGGPCCFGNLRQYYRRRNLFDHNLLLHRTHHVHGDIHAGHQLVVRPSWRPNKMQKPRRIINSQTLQGSGRHTHASLSVWFLHMRSGVAFETGFWFYRCMPQLARASAGIIFSFVPPCILCICSSLLMIEKVWREKKICSHEVCLEHKTINSHWRAFAVSG